MTVSRGPATWPRRGGVCTTSEFDDLFDRAIVLLASASLWAMPLAD